MTHSFPTRRSSDRVPEGATIVGIPGRAVQTTRPAQSAAAPFVAYGTPVGNIPDPIARALDGLLDEVQSLRARVTELEGRRRSEEHTSELQSLMRISYAVFCLKNKKPKQYYS